MMVNALDHPGSKDLGKSQQGWKSIALVRKEGQKWIEMGRDGGRWELTPTPHLSWAPVRKLPVGPCRGWGNTDRLVPLLFRIFPSP